MKLIKRLPARKDKNGRWQSYGIYLCPICLKEIEKQIGHGERDKSCGNHKYLGVKNSNYKHGYFGTKLYNVWNSMKSRCLNLNNLSYQDYGGRGITICNEWLNFIPFRDWSLVNGYQEGLEIDRINNNGNYSPENCHFVIHKVNCNNRRKRKNED